MHCISKWLFVQMQQACGLPALETTYLACEKDLEALPRSQTYAIKPVYSRASQELTKLEPHAPLPVHRCFVRPPVCGAGMA